MAIGVGDRVRYSSDFCRSIGAYTGDLPHARGEVKGLIPMAKGALVIAVVDWHNPNVPPKVNVKNLEKIGVQTHRPATPRPNAPRLSR